MTYIPKFNDKRVQTRIRKAIGFTQALLSEDKPRPMSSRFIDKHFGISSNKLSRYLRDQLLTCVDESYSKDNGKCKSYVMNMSGIIFLSGRINLFSSDKNHNSNTTTYNYPSVLLLQNTALEWAKEEYKVQLESKVFEYKDTSNRYFNPIQNIRSELRSQLLNQNGLLHQYDIASAAPTLLYQYYYMTPSATGEVLSTLEHYIANRSVVREKLSIESELTSKQIKVIVNALLAGAYLSKHPNTSIYKEVNGDIAVIEFLQQHPYITALRSDIKKLWGVIGCDRPIEYYITTTGKQRKRPFNSKAKWSVYFELERLVMNAVISHMKFIGNTVFLEHDGFTSQYSVDVIDLSDWVRHKTGFDIKFEKKDNE
jgi:hypothetical protein